MARGVRAIVGVVGIIVGTVYGQPWLTAYGASLLAGAALEKKIRTPTQSPEGLRVNSVGGIYPLGVPFGKVRLGGQRLVPAKTTDNNADGRKESYHIAIAHCISNGQGVEALGDIYFDNELIEASDISGGEIVKSNYLDADSNSMVGVRSYLGTSGQTVDSVLSTAYGSEWDSNHTLKGVPYTAFQFVRPEGEANEEAFQKVFGRGPPVEINRVVSGTKCYDVRLDSTRGGSGSHRADDPSTWEYSVCPPVCATTYILLSEKDGGLGGDPDLDFTDEGWATIAAASTVCDATFSDPEANTIAKYTFNGLLASDDPIENLNMIADAMAGVINYDILAGTWKMFAGEYTAPSETIDETWLAGKLQYTTKKELGELYNFVKVGYVNADKHFAETICKPRSNSSYETADGGLQLPREISVPGIDNEYRAQYRGEIELKRSREQKALLLPCNMKAATIAWWDTVTVDLPEHAGVYRVVEYGWEDGWPFLVLLQANSNTYNTGDEDAQSFGSPPTPAVSPPPEPTNLTLTATPEGVRITVDPLGRTVAVYEYQRYSDDSGPDVLELTQRFTDSSVIDSVSTSALRHYRVRSIGKNGQASAWTSYESIGTNPAETGATFGELVNIMPQGYGDFEKIPASVSSFFTSSLGADTHHVQKSGATFLGNSCLLLRDSGSDGVGVYLGTSTSDYNIKITPGRRWLVTCRIRPASGASVSSWYTSFFTASGSTVSDDDATVSSDTEFQLVAWEIDATGDTDTEAVLRIYSSDFTANVSVRIDAVCLFDVTNHPSITTANFPPEYLPATGAPPENVVASGADATVDQMLVGSGSYVTFHSNPAGAAPADATRDLVANFRDIDDNVVATRTLRGTFTNSTATWAVTNVSSSGLTTSYSLTGDGSVNVFASVTVTMASGREITSLLAWYYTDISSAGSTPSTGGSKS